MAISRRGFIRTIGKGAAAAALGAGHYAGRAQNAPVSDYHVIEVPELVSGSVVVRDSITLPPPQESGIQHIVVVTLENRSFDHLLGWLPGADGKQAGLSYADKVGVVHSTYRLAPDYTGCGHPDPNHSYSPSRVAYNDGAMDGFLRAGNNDVYSIGYYTDPDLPFLSALAQQYLVCDRYFASVLGPTFPNRMFLWAAQSDRVDNDAAFTSLPTIFDRLSAAGVSHRYYFSSLPYLGLWGFKYLGDAAPFQDFVAQARDGTLPAVSFIDPIFTTADDGTGNDDHPHADIRNGEAFLATIFNALSSGSGWRGTVLIINFDEWGGFFEHVAPPRVVAPNNVDQDLINGEALLGFRVPALVVSPFTRNSEALPLSGRIRQTDWRRKFALVNHAVCDHTSVLKLIEWRWGLQPLTARDASPQISNLAAVMNFSAPDASIPALPNPQSVTAPPCLQPGILLSPDTSSPEAEQSSGGSPWGALARAPVMQQWLQHPRFAFGNLR